MGGYKDFHARSLRDREGFWRERAALVDWQTPFTSVLDYSRPPFARWFVGGRTNLCHNAVDRHLATRGDQAALVYVSTETGQEERFTYRDLHAHPELSMQEIQTPKKLAPEMRKLGFSVTEHVGKTGLIAVLRNGPGPVLMLRADMDALPVKELTGLPFASKAVGKLPDGTETPVMHA